MRELRAGDKTIRVRATPLALLFYRQQFKTDLLGDLIGMIQSIGLDRIRNLAPGDTEAALEIFAGLDVLKFLQITWAMAKADAYGQQFPSFEQWLAELGKVDLFDPEFLLAALGEAADGFLGGRST